METSIEGLDFIDPPSLSSWLELALPVIANWFRRRYGEPTEIQRAAWACLPTGRHLLISAPTGSGKTLAVFLPILTKLIAGTGRVRIDLSVRFAAQSVECGYRAHPHRTSGRIGCAVAGGVSAAACGAERRFDSGGAAAAMAASAGHSADDTGERGGAAQPIESTAIVRRTLLGRRR